MLVSYLPNPEAHPLWNDIKALLKPAADYGEIPVRDDDELVWIAFEDTVLFGAATTILYDDGEAEIRLAGGRHVARWIDGLNILESWARDAGASRLAMRGRRGWLRLVRRFGWDAVGIEDGRTIYEKDLTGGR